MTSKQTMKDQTMQSDESNDYWFSQFLDESHSFDHSRVSNQHEETICSCIDSSFSLDDSRLSNLSDTDSIHADRFHLSSVIHYLNRHDLLLFLQSQATSTLRQLLRLYIREGDHDMILKLQDLVSSNNQITHFSFPESYHKQSVNLIPLDIWRNQILIYFDIQTLLTVFFRVCREWRGIVLGMKSFALSRYHLEYTDHYLSSVTNRFREIRYFDLSNCQLLTDLSCHFLQECPLLTSLKLKSCTHITDLGLKLLVAGCPRLRFLDLDSCIQITNTGIAYISSLPLQYLVLSRCFNVTDHGILHIVQCASSLNDLAMVGLNIHDSTLSIILLKCHYLHIIDCSICINLTDQCFLSFVTKQQKSQLIRIGFNYCNKITSQILNYICQACPFLEVLGIRETGIANQYHHNNNNHDTNILDKLQQECPNLKNIFIHS